MTPSLAFLIQALTVLALPSVLLRIPGLKRFVPLVVMQIVVGIALGPSVFGRIAPGLFHTFLNADSLSALSGIAAFAVLVFGLITGLHLDFGVFNRSARTVGAVVLANVIAPATLGCLAGFWILQRHPEELPTGVSWSEFTMAIAISAGVTALPVLGAILREMNMLPTRIGQLALGVAGIKDAVLWIGLGILLITGNGGGGLSALTKLCLIPVYLFVMARFARPVLRRMVVTRVKDGAVDGPTLAVVCALTIASALATEAIGLHYVFGAFVTGVIMPTEIRKSILDRLEVVTIALLMPFFFTLTGMRTLIDFGSPAFVDVLFASTITAICSIIGGTAIAARLAGESWCDGFALGSLLQTKGLMELIVLTILLDAGIISVHVFAALILMAVIATALAMPLTKLMSAHQEGRGHMGAFQMQDRPTSLVRSDDTEIRAPGLGMVEDSAALAADEVRATET